MTNESTFTFEEDEVLPGFPAGAPIWVDSGVRRLPGAKPQANFVSLKAWQRESTMANLAEQMRVAAKVFGSVTGASKQTELQGIDLSATATVIEAVTGVLPGDNAVEAAFDRCLKRIRQLVTAYGLAARQSIAPPTLPKLPMLVLYANRRVDRTSFYDASLLHLHYNDVIRHLPAPVDDAQLGHFVGELEVGGPRVAYMQLAAEARRFFDREGDARTAVIMAAAACEVFLDGVLSCLLWEEGVSPEQAAVEYFNGYLTARVKRYFAPRLGGCWSISEPGPVAAWHAGLASLRNRCVHAGHLPGREEALAASNAEVQLVEFVMGQLRSRSTIYPRAASIVGAARSTSGPNGRRADVAEHGKWESAVSLARSDAQ